MILSGLNRLGLWKRQYSKWIFKFLYFLNFQKFVIGTSKPLVSNTYWMVAFKTLMFFASSNNEWLRRSIWKSGIISIKNIFFNILKEMLKETFQLPQKRLRSLYHLYLSYLTVSYSYGCIKIIFIRDRSHMRHHFFDQSGHPRFPL